MPRPSSLIVLHHHRRRRRLARWRVAWL